MSVGGVVLNWWAALVSTKEKSGCQSARDGLSFFLASSLSFYSVNEVGDIPFWSCLFCCLPHSWWVYDRFPLSRWLVHFTQWATEPIFCLASVCPSPFSFYCLSIRPPFIFSPRSTESAPIRWGRPNLAVTIDGRRQAKREQLIYLGVMLGDTRCRLFWPFFSLSGCQCVCGSLYTPPSISFLSSLID